MSLISNLVEQLGISEQQAEGGAGALFSMAKEQLASGDFAQLTDAVPEITALVGSAPEAGGAGGMLGKLGGMLGGKAESMGQLAAVASSFSKLGLNREMISEFVPLILSYVQEQGGEGVRGILEKALSPGA